MEFLEPGHTLKSLLKIESDETVIGRICEIILKLQTVKASHDSYKHISELAESLNYLKSHIKTFTLSKVKSLVRDLSIDKRNDVLLLIKKAP